ncbi:hypothetical protein AEAC466_01675 [Asticcacaulis sp. AC466]|nr:hypothetical protein AEAC466_01675 [Asticcacaulis sp. AC466]
MQVNALRQSLKTAVSAKPSPPAWRGPVLIGVVALAVAAAGVFGVGQWHRATPAAPPVARSLTPAERDAAEAQAGPTGSPLLWVVKTGDATLYLFGSIHMLRQNLNWMDSRLFQAFDMSDEAWFELPDLEYQPKFKGFKATAYASRPVLLDGLSDLEKHQLETIVNRYNYTLDDLVRVKPSAMAGFISQMDLVAGGFSVDRGVDYNLFRRAKSLKMKIDGFESNSVHYSYLSDREAPTQAEGTRALKQALAAHFGTGVVPDEIHVLSGHWRAGDQKALTESVNRMAKETPEVYKTLLVKRNSLWMPRIEAILKGKHRVFATVGVAHLVGPDGLVAQLRARGYEVTRLDPTPKP